MQNEISKLILTEAKTRMETEAHQDMNAAIHTVWMEAGLYLIPVMRENAGIKKEETP